MCEKSHTAEGIDAHTNWKPKHVKFSYMSGFWRQEDSFLFVNFFFSIAFHHQLEPIIIKENSVVN